MARGNGRNKFISVNGWNKQRICDGRARGGRWQCPAVWMKEQVGRVGRNKCNTRGFHSISLQGKAEDGADNVCSHSSQGRNLCTPQPSSASLEQTMVRDRELQLGSHWWGTTAFLEENQSQQRFNWLLCQTCYYSRLLTCCRCPTPSLWLPGVILDPIHFLLPAHRFFYLNWSLSPVLLHTSDNPASWKSYIFHLWDYLFLISPL